MYEELSNGVDDGRLGLLVTARELGRAFLKASAALEEKDRADFELVNTARQIMQAYAQPIAASYDPALDFSDPVTVEFSKQLTKSLAKPVTTSKDIKSKSDKRGIVIPEALIPKITCLERLRKSLSYGAAKEFPLGTEIPDVWRDPFGEVHDNPLVVMQYRAELCADGIYHFGVELARKFVIPTTLPFSQNGGNRFSKSEVDVWLNNDAGGYLMGCSDELGGILADQTPVRLRIPIGKRFKNVIYDVCDCYAYLPSGANVYPAWGVDDTQAPDGELWEYYRKWNPAFQTLFGDRCSCWLRSAVYGSHDMVWTTDELGSVRKFDITNPVRQQACALICHFIHL